MGMHWAFHAPGPNEAARVTRNNNGLTLRASGNTPTDSRPLTFINGDLAYEVEADIELGEGAEAGVHLGGGGAGQGAGRHVVGPQLRRRKAFGQIFADRQTIVEHEIAVDQHGHKT